jgi:hypothetical protein
MAESPYSISAILSVGEANASFATWNSGTTINTVALLVNNDYSYNTLVVTLNQTTTITGGVVTFEGSIDGITFFPIQGFAPGTFTAIGPTYTIQASTYATFSFNLTAIPYFQIRLSTALTGTGAVTIGYAADSFVNSIAINGTVNQGTSPWVVDVTQWANTVVGVPQTFGTAPTGVVIGTSSDIYVAGTRARSNQTTTAAGVQDVNIVGSLGLTNSVTNGTFIAITDNITKVGVIAATTALKTDMSSVAGTATVTATAGVQKVGIVGNAGGVLDAVTGAAVPANAIQVGASDGTLLQPLSINVKGTQGARGLAVQELKDAGRTVVVLYVDNIVAPATEALQTMNINRGGTISTATSYTVTAGKTFRIQSVTLASQVNTGIGAVKARIRAAATVLVTSPIYCTLFASPSTTTGTADVGNAEQVFPDGLEIAAGQQVGISTLSQTNTGNATVCIVGYEY